MIGSGVAHGRVVGLSVGPVKSGRGGRVIVPAVHGRAPRPAAQPIIKRHAAGRGKGLWAAGAIAGEARHAAPFGAFRGRLSPLSSMQWAVWSTRSRIASPRVGSPMTSCHEAKGTWLVISSELRS